MTGQQGRTLLLLSFLLLSCSPLASAHNIQHVIALMMENRSFDNLLGWLHLLNPEIEGLTGNEKNFYLQVSDDGVEKFAVPVNNQGFDTGPDDPCHSFECTSEQIYGKANIFGESLEGKARMNGFAQNAVRHDHTAINPMSMFDNSSAPILNTLAMEFAVFDHWHCSVPGPTDPNRQFYMSGQSDSVLTNFNGTLWAQQSYFDLLTQKNLPWKAYYQGDPWAIMYFNDTHKAENARNIFTIDQFFNDLKGNPGDFPKFSFLQPSLNVHMGQRPTWQHPDASVSAGEQLIKDVYEGIRQSPIWENSVFIITYDEHGGFFDHVPPPQNGIPPPDNRKAPNGFGFDRLGIRVPTVVVSPFVNRGTVVHTPNFPTSTSQFESTSIMATTNLIFNLSDASLSDRVAWAGTFEDIFTEEARNDALLWLPEVKKEGREEEARLVERQLEKNLNDHQEAQIVFYCLQNYGVGRGERVGEGEERCGEGLVTQREGTAWLDREIANFEKRVLEPARATTTTVA